MRRGGIGGFIAGAVRAEASRTLRRGIRHAARQVWLAAQERERERSIGQRAAQQRFRVDTGMPEPQSTRFPWRLVIAACGIAYAAIAIAQHLGAVN